MHRYSSGDWYTLVTAEGIAMLPDSVSPEFVEPVWLALSEGKGLAAVLDGIVGAFGASLSSLPPFAVASRTAAGSGVQVAVRGPIDVIVRAEGRETAVNGLGVTTWTERSIFDVESVEAALPGAAATALPINDGVVLANRIRFAFGESRDTAPRAAQQDAPHPDFAPLDTALPDFAPLEAAQPDTAQPDTAQPDAVQREPSAAVVNSELSSAPEEVPLPASEPAGAEVTSAESEAGAEPMWGTAPEEAEDPAEAEEPAGPPLDAGQPSGETTIAPLPGGLFAPAEERLDDDYDQLLYGDTVISTVEDAAVRVTDEFAHPEPDAGTRPLISALPSFAPREDTTAPSGLGDHDGETISLAKLRAMQAQAPAPTALSGPPLAGPAQRSPITLLVSTGERFTLDRGAVVGRRPRLARVQGGNVPQLVTVPSPNQDVSRSHVELRVEGAHLLAVDLDTTNGTKLLRPGLDPIRLQPGEATMLVTGDRLDLGDGILLEFEGLR